MIKKYYLQTLIVLLLIGIAWALLSIRNDNKPIQANINQSQGDKVISKLPNSNDIDNKFFPIRNWSVEEPDIFAKSAVVLNFRNDRKDNTLLQKNINQVLPIASLTKLMTAIVVMENYNPEAIIKVSKEAINVDSANGGLIDGEELKVKDLLYIMLVESSNDAAMSLAKDNPQMTYDEFILKMNSRAKELGLKNTSFVEPVGLDAYNQSTVSEIAILTEHAFKFPLLAEILKTPETTIYSLDKSVIHRVTSTNKLLGKIPQLVGGKTGFTDEAGGCLMTISKIYNDNYLITVILGSTQRENDTEKLIDWAQNAWIWQ